MDIFLNEVYTYVFIKRSVVILGNRNFQSKYYLVYVITGCCDKHFQSISKVKGFVDRYVSVASVFM